MQEFEQIPEDEELRLKVGHLLTGKIAAAGFRLNECAITPVA